MKTIDVISNGKHLCIEICEVWGFVRDVHSFQAHVVDKAAKHRDIVGMYKTSEIAENKAMEWIAINKK